MIVSNIQQSDCIVLCPLFLIMSFVTDFAFNQFLSFRLGRSAATPSQCVHIPSTFVDDENLGMKKKDRTVHYEALPICENVIQGVTRVCVVSDTHERHSALHTLPNSCQVLIHAGDILMSSSFLSKGGAISKLHAFNDWLGQQAIPNIIVVAGNHDLVMEQLSTAEIQAILTNAVYLCNSSVTVCGLTVWGTPLSRGRSHNSAFQSREFADITQSTINELCNSGQTVDILVTHGTCADIAQAVKPRLAHISGHLHGRHGVFWTEEDPNAVMTAVQKSAARWLSVAAPIMNSRYEPHQLPIVLDIPRSSCTGN